MDRARSLRSAAAALIVVVAGVMPTMAGAASLAELRAQAQGAGLSPGSGGAGEQAALDRLGRTALAFLDAADGADAGAVGTYEAIAGPLERSYESHRQALDRMSQSVIDADGDMDAMVESPAYKEHQALAAQALYYLNWLRYRGALLYGSAKRRELLDKAAAGFGEFATAQSDNPIVAESRLGRGLAYLELDQVDWAIADFEAVTRMKTASPERIRKAELALAESYVRVGRSAEALRASKQALEGATVGDRPRAQYTRARALLMAAASQPAQRATHQSEASSLLAQLQAEGGPWGTRAAQIVRNGLDNPKNWAGSKAKDVPPPPAEWDVTKQLVASGKFKDAIPRLEKVLASTDAEDQKNQGEARYLLGLARYRSGDLAGAIAVFDQVLAEKAGGTYRDDAGYLRFKASEARFAADPSPANIPAYEQALQAFLRDFPKHKAAPEARFRLGELRQGQEQFAAAEAEYAQVKGDPSFELRAAFASAQCLVKQLEQTPEGAKPDPQLMTRARAALESFWAQRARGDGKEVEASGGELGGQAALMSAYLAALAEPPEYERALEWLEGFEEKYPKLASVRPQVVKLRLQALSRLGRLEAAAVEAARPEVAGLDPNYLDDLATRFLVTAAREQAAGKAEAAAAGKRAALLLSERALAAPSAAALSPVVRRRLQSTAASLHEERGELDPALALYRAVLKDSPDVVSARAGAARILERQGKAAEARALWDEMIGAPPGKQGWMEAHYQSARLSVALGDQTRACAVLRQVPVDMLANASAETPKKIQEMLRACS